MSETWTLSQAEFERAMADLGVSRYQQKLMKARSKQTETSTPPVRYLLRESVRAVSDGLKAWRKRVDTGPGWGHSVQPLLVTLKPDVIALVACQYVLDSITTERTYNSLVYQLGLRLEDEVRNQAFMKAAGMEWVRLRREHAKKRKSRRSCLATFRKAAKSKMHSLGVSHQAWKMRDRSAVGMVLFEIFTSNTDLVEVHTRRAPGGTKKKFRTHRVVVVSDKTLDWLEKSNERHEALSPMYMPTPDVPADWTNPDNGGYHTNILFRRPLVKSRSRSQRVALEEGNMRNVYGAANILQRTAWEVNPFVLDVMRHHWERSHDLADLPTREDEALPSKPLDIDTNEDSRKTYGRAAGRIYRRNAEHRSRRLQVVKRLAVATRYQGRPFYYPTQLDFRGRLYYLPYFLQPQGPSPERGLLRFHGGKPVDSPYWLAIHGANCWGVDKVPMNERAAWVFERDRDIRAVGKDPLSSNWWAEADDPWKFLAFADEWYRFSQHGKGFVSRIPVSLDGSNNGLQVFSLLLRDSLGGRATNCLPTASPEDIYQDVADAVTTRLVSEAKNLGERRVFASKWLRFTGGKLPREATKRPVMTLPYGATVYSARKYILEWAQDLHLKQGGNPFKDDFVPATSWLAELVWEAIGQTVGSAKECMSWLQDVARCFNEESLPMAWTSPSGFPVRQVYHNYDVVRVKTSIGGSVKYSKYRKNGEKLNFRRQVNSVSPNYVHSLDAAAMVGTVNTCYDRGITQFSSVHDSYGVPAADAPLLARTLREVWSTMFQPDLLSLFRDECQRQLRQHTLKDLPEYGDLEIDDLLDADYFFH